MKEIHKQMVLAGIVNRPSTMTTHGVLPLVVNITRDKRGCSLSIGCEATDVLYTIPMEAVLKELKK